MGKKDEKKHAEEPLKEADAIEEKKGKKDKKKGKKKEKKSSDSLSSAAKKNAALKKAAKGKSKRVASVDTDLCYGCGRCVKVCKVSAISLIDR